MSQIRIKASLIIQLIDSYTGQAPIGGVNVMIDGLPTQPIKKQDGIFIFTNLPHGSYETIIRSSHYVLEKRKLECSDNRRPNLISLIPNRSYPKQEEITSLYVSVENDRNEKIQSVEIVATTISPKCEVAKVAIDVERGSTIVVLSKLRRIFVGDSFLLVEKNGTHSELCTIIDHCVDEMKYTIEEKLNFDYSRGAMLYPVTKSVTDENGEACLYFRDYPVNEFEVEVEVRTNDQRLKKETVLVKGSKTSLGVITL